MIVRKIGQGRMHEFNIFEQVDGKAGRQGGREDAVIWRDLKDSSG